MAIHTLPESALPDKSDAGLALRDYFAAAALNALLSAPRSETNDGPPARYAEIAYAYADAMLVARGSGLI